MPSSTAVRAIVLCLLLVVLVSASGCAAIAGIFKAGMWVGVLAVVAVIAIIVFIASKFRG